MPYIATEIYMTTEADMQLLMTISDRFQLVRLGVVLTPDFSVPEGNWIEQTHSVTIETPSGERFNSEAVFGLSHFNIRDPQVPIDRRWRVTVRLPQEQKEQIPIGSRVYAPSGLVAVLHKKSQAEQDAP
jgi:hypothetical protein